MNLNIITTLCFLFLSFHNIEAQIITFDWAKQMGAANGNDEGHSISTDKDGNIYTTGHFMGTADFDPGIGTFNLNSAGSNDIFITKLDSLGNFVWAKSIGGASYDNSYGITVDESNNVYTTGVFSGTVDFDPSLNIYNLNAIGGSSDVFVSKLDSSGNFIWAKNLGGANNDRGYSLINDSYGNIYTTGYFKDTADFDPGIGVFNLFSLGDEDIFISKLDSSGNFIWAKSIGGTFLDEGYGVVIDNSDNVYTTGWFYGTVDFDPGIGVFNLIPSGFSDIYISKLDSAGNFIWAKNLGGSAPNGDIGHEIVADSFNNIYSTGVFNGVADFDPGIGVFNLIPLGNSDVYISKLDSAGNFIWAKNLGGSAPNGEIGYSLALDKLANLYTVGSFWGMADFDPGAGVFNMNSVGNDDVFVQKLDSAGNFIWAKQMGGLDFDSGLDIAISNSGSIHTTGYFSGISDFDIGPDTVNLTSFSGSLDIFVHKMKYEVITSDNFLSNKSGIMNIYPNPTNNLLFLESEELINSILITDISGRIIYSQKNNTKRVIINTSQYKNGTYFITIGSSINYNKIFIVNK